MLRVCLVDDESLLLAGLQRILRRASPSMSVTLAESGAAAMAVLSQQPVDVLISDLRMPGMDGATLLSGVQAQFPRMARVLCTGAIDPDLAFELQLVAHRIVAKPMDIAALIAMIEELGELVSQRHPASDSEPTPDLPWAAAAARRLQEQEAHAITAEVARGNPWLAALLLQATHGGFAGSGKPLDMDAAVRVLGAARLEIMQRRLCEPEWHAAIAALTDTASSTPELAPAALSELACAIAHDFAELQCETSPECAETLLAVTESAALLRMVAGIAMSPDATDRDVTLRSALDAALLGVPRLIVDAVRGSIEGAECNCFCAGAALRWAVALLLNPERQLASAPGDTLAASVPLPIQHRWREHASALQAACRTAV